MANYCNQELENKKMELEEILRKKLEDLEMKRKWVREAELEIESLENEITAIGGELEKSGL